MPVVPVYVIVSESISSVPVGVENPVVEVTVTVVLLEESVPPDTAVVAVPVINPPQVPAPQPTFWVKMSLPVVIWYTPTTADPPFPESPAAALTEAVMVYWLELT